MNNVIFNSMPVTPSKIICIGWNYVEHINELGSEQPDEPVIFMKPNSAISGELYFDPVDAVHYEAEIAFIIKNNQLAGVGFGLDLTKRELQAKLKAKGQPWERAKAFNNAAVFSEFVPLEDDISTLSVKLAINDVTVQHGGVELMIFKPDVLLKEIVKSFKLEDGDILMSGTPKGVGTFNIGDQFNGQIFSNNTLLVEKKWIAK